jgi:hypothetical protein
LRVVRGQLWSKKFGPKRYRDVFNVTQVVSQIERQAEDDPDVATILAKLRRVPASDSGEE